MRSGRFWCVRKGDCTNSGLPPSLRATPFLWGKRGRLGRLAYLLSGAQEYNVHAGTKAMQVPPEVAMRFWGVGGCPLLLTL
jgi:hypothetical protein